MAFVAPMFAAIGTAAAGAGTFVSTAASVLSAGATVGSVIMGMRQANYERQAAQQQASFELQAGEFERQAGRAAASDAMLDADLARLEGQQEATASEARADDIRRNTLRRLGAARVAFAASGLDISSNQLDQISGTIQSDSDYQLGIERANRDRGLAGAGLTSLRYQTRAANELAAGDQRAWAAGQRSSAALQGGKSRASGTRMSALATGASGLLSLIKRG